MRAPEDLVITRVNAIVIGIKNAGFTDIRFELQRP